MPRDGNAEARIQRAILEFLWLVAPQLKVFHVANGAFLAGKTKKDRDRAAARLKWQGMLPGVPDLVLVEPLGRVFFIEVKAGSNDLEPEQEAFHDWCLTNAVPWMVARSIDDVKAALMQWRVPTREAA